MNEILSEYIIEETIGKGTFSIVKLGINKITKEKVAIKILKKNKMIHEEDIKRIEREISILKKLDHINVIKIYKIDEDFEKYYIFMEYCENGELFHYIVERQRLSEEESSFFFYQLINGLQYIHSENIVHRDLKPENLLLGKNNILKIIDFGLSNFSEPENYLETPCGSPCYASPEMVSGKKYDGHIIDIWSTGIILFAMLCGYLPFEDQDNDILFKKILKCKIKYPEYLSEISIDLMKKILVREPDKRITLNDIKVHPFYLKGKNIFAKIHHELINEVEKIDNNNNKDVKLIKNIKINNINNMVTSKDMKDESNYNDILNTSTKNYFYEQNDDDFDYLNKKYKKLSHNLYNKISKKMKKEIKEMNDKNNYKLIEKKPEKKMGHKEIVYNLINAEVGSNDNSSSFNLNKLLQDKTMKEKEKKEKQKNNENRPFSTENKNIHQCETGVAINYNIYNYNNNYNNNINYNSDTKNNNTNLSLLQKLLNNNKIILHNNEPKSPSNIKKPEKNKILKGNTLKELFKNYKTEYKINKKLAKSQEHEKSFISKSFKSQTISEKEKARKNKSYNKFTSSINLKKNKIKKEKDKDTFNNNNNIKANMKPSLYKEIKYNKHNFNSNININMNINFLSANNNLTNNINIIKSPLKTSRKNENYFSKQYTMKFDLGRLKSKHGNNNNTNNTNNTNKNDYSASLSGINLNNINNFDINRLKNNNMNMNMNFSYLSNNNISPCNSNMSITSRKNNFFNHKKLLIATLNKKIKSPQQNKLSNYINLSSGDFLKIKKNMISKKHKKNEINFKNNNNHNFSNIISNISNSGIINLNKITSNINIRPQNKSTKNKSSKKIPLIGLNINNNKKIKQNNETFSFRKKKEKEKEKKHLSFGKAYININIKEFLSGKMNYKKISNKTKDNIITIKKMNKCISNKSKTKILDKRINSGNRTTVNNNNHNNFKFFKGINVLLDGNNMRRDMISGNNNNKILVNSFIKFQKKNANKK